MRVVSREEWLESRVELLAAEKELTRRRDEVAGLRRQLPWVRVEKEYVFDSASGPVTLAGLFGDKSQLIVYHFMLGENWEEGCKSCSYLADHFDGMTVHLAHRDTAFAVASSAPYSRIARFQLRMGWKFRWVSGHRNEFGRDYGVHLTKEDLASGDITYNFQKVPFGMEEMPGLSVFAKSESGDVFHTYSTYARGLDNLIGTYQFLDLVPKGRDEDGLKFTMAWVRHHDKYGDGYMLRADALYEMPKCSCEEGA